MFAKRNERETCYYKDKILFLFLHVNSIDLDLKASKIANVISKRKSLLFSGSIVLDMLTVIVIYLFFLKVDNAWNQGNRELALKHSQNAKKLGIGGLIGGLIVHTCVIVTVGVSIGLNAQRYNYP